MQSCLLAEIGHRIVLQEEDFRSLVSDSGWHVPYSPGLTSGDGMLSNASCESYMLAANTFAPSISGLAEFGATVTQRSLAHSDEAGSHVLVETALLQVGSSAPRRRRRLGDRLQQSLGPQDEAQAASEGDRLQQSLGPQDEAGDGQQQVPLADESSPRFEEAGAPAVPLQCECASWNCHCNKGCMCKKRSDTFGGERLGPVDAMASIANVSPDFQCTCDSSEVGGPNPSFGGSVDCECAEARCRCERRCACTPK
jgi:hypothetical protein